MGQADNAAVDLNRALPALPTHSSSHLLSNPSSNPSSSSSQPVEKTDSRLTGSTLTPNVSVSQQHFRKPTHELLVPSTPQYSPRTTDKLGLLDPVKYIPVEGYEKTSNMPTVNSPYKGGSTTDPHRDLRFTQIEEMYNGAVQCTNMPHYINSSMGSLLNDSIGNRATHAMNHNGAAEMHEKSQGMSQSLSETDFFYRRQHGAAAVIRSPHFEMKDIERESPLLSVDNGLVSPPESPTRRGRPTNRTPSPIKLEDIKEDQPMNFPSSPIKRSRSPVKQLFGENGWLGRSTSMKEMPSEEFRKNGFKHWGGKLKQRVELITEDVSRLIHYESLAKKSPESTPVRTSKFPVSLGPPVQARVYSEIELMICATANQYLMTQRREGRMTLESIAKITDYWTSRNRPQVIEFMFDQLTQRDLVLHNIKTFRFYGPNAENPVSMNAMMLSWKSLAKEMSVRTFCQPDSVVRKHMHDCYKILEMLGAPLVTFLAFQEIQFKSLKLIKEKQQLRDQYEKIQFGMERRWEPLLGKASIESDETGDPFVG